MIRKKNGLGTYVRFSCTLAYVIILSGVLCAETIVSSYGTPNCSKTSAAARIVGRSESLPMMTLTTGCGPLSVTSSSTTSLYRVSCKSPRGPTFKNRNHGERQEPRAAYRGEGGGGKVGGRSMSFMYNINPPSDRYRRCSDRSLMCPHCTSRSSVPYLG